MLFPQPQGLEAPAALLPHTLAKPPHCLSGHGRLWMWMRRANDFIGLGWQQNRHRVSNYLGNKKRLAARVSVSHVLQCEIRFAASKCEMFCGDCGYRSAKKWRGAGGGRSAADEAGQREEPRSARVFMTNKREYQRDEHLGWGGFWEWWLGTLIGLQL